MLPLLLLLAGAAGATPTRTPEAVADAVWTKPAIVVFWASWCVSCRAELTRLPMLAAAAAPLPVLTLALDPRETARQALGRFGVPAATAFHDARPPGTVLADWGGPATALPLAVAIDRAGHVCGIKRGLLGTDQLKQWAARCS